MIRRFRPVPTVPIWCIIPFVLPGAAPARASQTTDDATVSAPSAAAPTPEPTPPPPYRRTLPSGLHVIVATEPGAKQTAIEVRVRVGSAMETPETNGLAHLIEHMVFKGTASGKPGDIDRAIEALGGDQLTARTSRDSTRFATVVSNKNWQTALDTIGDMLEHPAFRAEDLANEKFVIQGEMAQTDSLADRTAYGDLAALAFGAGDADRLPIMGTPANLDRFTADDLRAFWAEAYKPQNFTVVVVGGAPAEDVVRAADRLFPAGTTQASAPTPAAATPVSAPPDTPDAAASAIVRTPRRLAAAQGERELETVTLGFPGPEVGETEKMPVVETLLTLLAGASPTASRTGRLGVTLVGDRHIALTVSAVYLPGRQRGLFLVSATGTTDTGAARLEAGLVAALRRFGENPVSDDEVAVARASAAGEVESDDSTLAGRARRLADADARGIPPELADSYAARIRAVTTGEVRAAVARYLTPDRYFATVSGGPVVGGHGGTLVAP